MENPKYHLFKDTELLIWAQLADHISTRIEQCEFSFGDSLPSKKMLASEYAVSPTTVRRAIADLLRRNVVTRTPGGRLFPVITGEAESMKLTRRWWRKLAWQIHDNPDAMDSLELYSPRAWVHGFRADVRRKAMAEEHQAGATA